MRKQLLLTTIFPILLFGKDLVYSRIHWRNLALELKIKFHNDRKDSLVNRALIRREAKEKVLEKLSVILENLAVDSNHLLKDYFPQNTEFSRRYGSFLESVKLDSVYLRHGFTEARILVPFRGENGLYAALPMKTGFEKYIMQDDTISEAYQRWSKLSMYPTSRAPVQYSGFVIDARHLNIQEALAPRVYDQDGKLIYGPEYLPKKVFIDRGVAGYANSLDAYVTRTRAGENPLYTVAMATQGKIPTNVVITRSDAAKMLESKESIRSLLRARVVILVK